MLSLFVYGTLMSNNEKSKLLFPQSAKFISATCLGRLIDLGHYPGLIKGTDRVYGEIVMVEDPKNRILQALDYYEDYYPKDLGKSMYIRKKVIAQATQDNREYQVWTYFFNGSPEAYPVITSGCWQAK